MSGQLVRVMVVDDHDMIRRGLRHLLSSRPRYQVVGEAPDGAEATNPDGFTGSLGAALAGADVFIGVSAPDILTGGDVASMAEGSIVFALANPVPEIDPGVARQHAAVVATGRSDYPNQINNVLAFPGVFRGLLDSRASEITTEMLLRAASAIALVVKDEELNPNFIIPTVFHPDVPKAVAAAIRGDSPHD